MNATYFIALALKQRRAATSREAARALVDAAMFEADLLRSEREERQAALPSLEDCMRAESAQRAETLALIERNAQFTRNARAFLAGN